MSLFFDTSKIVWDEFGGLEPPQEEWRTQFAYWEDYVRKFFASNGMPFDAGDSNVETWLMATDRAPFAAMVAELVPRLGDVAGTEAILFAHWLPDLHLGTSVTNFAMHALGLRDCFGFAISDRGLSAPFFAFDSLHKYLGVSGKRGLLIVADQKHVMYKSDLVARLNPKNAACILVLDTANTTGMRYAGYTRVVADDGAAAILSTFGFEAAQTRLIGPKDLIGDAVDAVATDERLVCTAPFAALGATDRPDLNHVLLCHDGDRITALGFAGVQP